MIKRDTSTLHNGRLPASIIKAISLSWSTGFSKHLCIKNWNYVQRSKKNITLRNLAPNSALAPEGRSTVHLGRGSNTGGDIFT
jgi:hypothetical protein